MMVAKLTADRETTNADIKLIIVGYEKNQLDVTGIDVYSCNVNSTCFEHHYAHHQEYRLYKNCVW